MLRSGRNFVAFLFILPLFLTFANFADSNDQVVFGKDVTIGKKGSDLLN